LGAGACAASAAVNPSAMNTANSERLILIPDP
jgi:hypothetical protein